MVLPVDHAKRLVAYVAIGDGWVDPNRPVQPLERVDPLEEVRNRLVPASLGQPHLPHMVHVQRQLDLDLARLELFIIEEQPDAVIVLLDG